jgi:thymidylate kinase
MAPDPQVVMMEGVAPGIGKSTLAEGLADSLRASGAAVDLFPEEQLFERGDFAEVAAGFRSKDFPTPAAFLHAYSLTLRRAKASQAWLILDWNCAGMASDLPWAMADRGRLDQLVRRVRSLAGGSAATVLYLGGDIEVAIRRAARQRGPGWVTRYVGIAAEHGVPPGEDIDRIVAYERDSHDLREADLRTLANSGWDVLELDAMRPEGAVLAQARLALGIDRPNRQA